MFRPHLVALSVADLDETLQWYVDKLGFTLKSRRDFPDHGISIAIVNRAGFQVELVKVAGSIPASRVLPDRSNPASLQGFGKIAFEVEDLEFWAADLRASGVKFHLPPTRNAEDQSTSFIVLDNEGNWLQFIELSSAG
jgi:catechol 2,3-dioxygenase-like lactoylglutathione lyase family enzyme